jgi:hypothetical protein
VASGAVLAKGRAAAPTAATHFVPRRAGAGGTPGKKEAAEAAEVERHRDKGGGKAAAVTVEEKVGRKKAAGAAAAAGRGKPFTPRLLLCAPAQARRRPPHALRPLHVTSAMRLELERHAVPGERHHSRVGAL